MAGLGGVPCLFQQDREGGSAGRGRGASRGIAGNIGGEEQTQRKWVRGLSWPHAGCRPHPGQDTRPYLSVPRLLLRKRRAILVTSSVRLQVARSVSLQGAAGVSAAFSQGA